MSRCSLSHTSQASSCTFHSQEAPRAQSAAVPPRTGTRGSMPEQRRACWPQESKEKKYSPATLRHLGTRNIILLGTRGGSPSTGHGERERERAWHGILFEEPNPEREPPKRPNMPLFERETEHLCLRQRNLSHGILLKEPNATGLNLLIPEETSTPCTPCTSRQPVHVKVGCGLRESQFMSRGSSLSPIALSIIIRRDKGTRNGSVYSTINRICSRI